MGKNDGERKRKRDMAELGTKEGGRRGRQGGMLAKTDPHGPPEEGGPKRF